jgi:hypothetical protein
MFSARHEFAVKSGDAGCPKETGRWIERAMDALITASGKYPTVPQYCKR